MAITFTPEWSKFREYVVYLKGLEDLFYDRFPCYFYRGNADNCGILVKEGKEMEVVVTSGQKNLETVVDKSEKSFLGFPNGVHVVDFSQVKSIFHDGKISTGNWGYQPPRMDEFENVLMVSKKHEIRKLYRENSMVDAIGILNSIAWTSLKANKVTIPGAKAAVYITARRLNLREPNQTEMTTIITNWENLLGQCIKEKETEIPSKNFSRLMHLQDSLSVLDEEETKNVHRTTIPEIVNPLKISKILQTGIIPFYSYLKVENDAGIPHVQSLYISGSKLCIQVDQTENFDIVRKLLGFPGDLLYLYERAV